MNYARLVSALVTVLVVSSASAAPTSPAPPSSVPSSDEARAIALFQQGELAYKDGRLQEAAALLVQAYALKPEPVILYNLGRAYEGLGLREKALDAYRRYLVRQPTTEDRKSIETRIATLQREIDEREALEREHERQVETARRDARRRASETRPSSPWPWIIGGAGVASLGAGTVFALLEGAREDDARAEPVATRAAEDLRDARTFATATNVSFLVGGALVATSLVLLVFDVARSRSATPPTARSR